MLYSSLWNQQDTKLWDWVTHRCEMSLQSAVGGKMASQCLTENRPTTRTHQGQFTVSASMWVCVRNGDGARRQRQMTKFVTPQTVRTRALAAVAHTIFFLECFLLFCQVQQRNFSSCCREVVTLCVFTICIRRCSNHDRPLETQCQYGEWSLYHVSCRLQKVVLPPRSTWLTSIYHHLPPWWDWDKKACIESGNMAILDGIHLVTLLFHLLIGGKNCDCHT